jgi:hypothetical protein
MHMTAPGYCLAFSDQNPWGSILLPDGTQAHANLVSTILASGEIECFFPQGHVTILRALHFQTLLPQVRRLEVQVLLFDF